MFKFYDANGVEWCWNKGEERVYCVEAEKEFLAKGENTTENGDYAKTLEEAIEVLEEMGYMDKE